jgi:hypothetical protein
MRKLTKSAPKTAYTRYDHGFAVPPTTSTSLVHTEDSSTASVRHPTYRQNDLNSNGIDIRDARIQLLNHLASHLERLQAERDSPGPSSQQVNGYLDGLDILARGCTEADVERFLEDAVFPKSLDPTYGRRAGLESAGSSLMSSHLVPNNPESQFRISQPKPDLLYGYSGDLRDGAITQPQFLAQEVLHPQNARFAEATTPGLRFPFLAIEFKAAGGTRGDLWVATNQCAGDSAACLNAINQLNTLLREYQSKQQVDNLSYCIAVDNNVAQLYISWKESDLHYYLQRVDTFLLSSPEHFRNFRKQVRNILDWGKDSSYRLGRLWMLSLRKIGRTSEAAKSRPPPSDKSTTERAATRRKSSRPNSRPSSDYGQTDEKPALARSLLVRKLPGLDPGTCAN